MNTSIVYFLIGLALLVTVPVALSGLGIKSGTWTYIGQVSATLSLVFPRGPIAGVLAVAWVASAALLVARHVLVARHRRAGAYTLIPLLWLPAAAAWLAADRFGIRPLDFDRSIVLLTAAHFHHAGFGVSVLLARARAPYGLALHQIGMVLVAIGITASDHLESVGASFIVCALVVWTYRATRMRASLRGWRRIALLTSAVAWTYPMLLAVSWALAQVGLDVVTSTLTPTLDAMVAQHGAVNAIALVLAGIFALTPTLAHSEKEASHADLASTV